MIALGIMGILTAALAGSLTWINKEIGALGVSSDLRSITQTVLARTDCNATISQLNLTYGPNPPIGVPVVLKDKKSNTITSSAGTVGSAFEHSVVVSGPWYAKVTWLGSSIGIVVAKKKNGSDNFAVSPRDGTVLNFSVGRHQLFSAPPLGTPLCQRRQTSGLLTVMELTNAGSLAMLIGMPSTTTTQSLLPFPMKLDQGCHKTCILKNYSSGWAAEFSDVVTVSDPITGEFISYTPVSPGMGPVYCLCAR